MPRVSLDVADAAELVGMLEFVSGWLAGDRQVLEPSLRRYVGADGYGVESLRGDVERFVFLLGGDGTALFGSDSG